ncbi:MAG: methyl-accepting chemotaxis protein [Solidesulfovibrio sp.]
MGIRRKFSLVLVLVVTVFSCAGRLLLDNALDRITVGFIAKIMAAKAGGAAAVDIQAETALMDSAKYTLAGMLAGMLVAIAVVGNWMLTRSVIRPVGHSIQKIQALTGDSLDPGVKHPEACKDEMAHLPPWVDVLIDKCSGLISLNRAVLDAVPDPLFMVDKDMRVTMANQATALFAGKTLETIEGLRCADIFNASACATSACPIAAGKNGGMAAGDPHVSCGQNGKKRILKSAVRAVADRHGNELGWLHLTQDVTDAVNRKNELEKHLRHVQDVNAAITDVSREINEAISAIFGKVDEVSDGASLQQRRVEETLTSMNQMTVSARDVADNAQAASCQAREARETAQEGETVVRQAIEAIQAVKSQTELLKENMARLGHRAQDIGRVLSVISDIADQTNLLALNAAIEAARAGEGGRGFAVVAGEVRKLAEKTMQATGEVHQAISSIQKETHTNLDITEQAAKAVDTAAALSGRSGETLGHIVGLVSRTAGQVQVIAAAAEEQSAVSEHISQALNDVNAVSLSTSKGMDESSQALMELSALAGRLRTEVLSVSL